jgi:hypothetical protein
VNKLVIEAMEAAKVAANCHTGILYVDGKAYSVLTSIVWPSDFGYLCARLTLMELEVER